MINIDANLHNADWPKRTPDKTEDLEVAQKWEEAKHPRGRGGRFVPTAFITVGGREIAMVKPKRAYMDKMVLLDVAKVDASLALSPSFYVGPGGKGAAIGTRYEQFGKFIETTDEPIETPEMYVNSEGVAMFTNGRHRWAWLRDHGVTAIPVAMEGDGVENARKHGYLVAKKYDPSQPRDAEGQWTSTGKVKVFHTTSKELTEFRVPYGFGGIAGVRGIHFTTREDFGYGSNRYPVELDVKNTLEIDTKTLGGNDPYIVMRERLTDEHDSVAIHWSGDGSTEWIIFDPKQAKIVGPVEREHPFDWNDVDEGLNTQYESIAEHIQRYTHDNDRSGITDALADSDYESYRDNLHALLRRTYGDRVPVSRKTGYAGGTGEGAGEHVSVSMTPTWSGDRYSVAVENVMLAGHSAEGELIVRRRGLVQKQEYKFGNTQIEIDPQSTAALSLNAARDSIRDEDLMAAGKDVDPNHVTVRYGLLNADVDALRSFIAKQSPFEAYLGSVMLFPASEHSDGAVPVVAQILSPALKILEQEIGKHADFKEKNFPVYKPHCTLAYCKPDASEVYADLKVQGSFMVTEITISHASGVKETIPFGMAQKWDEKQHPRDKDGKFVVFHGTDEQSVEAILRGGLVPGKTGVNWATTDLKAAQIVAERRSKVTGRKPVILEVAIPATEMGKFHSIEFPRNKHTGEAAYTHVTTTEHIPPAWLKVRKWDESKHKRQPAGSSRGGEFAYLHGVSDALHAALNGESVNIDRANVTKFLERLGEQEEDVNLTQVQVEGMKIFGGEGLGIPREEMPQIPKEHRLQFLKEMKALGITITREHVNPLDLKPTQKFISAQNVVGKIQKYAKGDRAFPPLLVSKEGRILDGHHHWGVMAALATEAPTAEVPVYRLNISVKRALQLMHAYDKKYGIKRKTSSDIKLKSKKWEESQHPRDKEGQFTVKQGWHLTDDPNFTPDPNFKPEWNSLGGDLMGEDRPAGLFTGDPEFWMHAHGYERPYVALVEGNVKSRSGAVMYKNREEFMQAPMRTVRVVTLDEYAREEFGSQGWVEEYFGDGPKKIPKGYKARSVSEMSAEELAAWEKRFAEYAGRSDGPNPKTKKYDPSQPRDAHGRFSESGSGNFEALADGTGKPLVLYHGGRSGVTTFKVTNDKYKTGFYASSSQQTAQSFATWVKGSVYPVHLQMKKPFVVDARGEGYAEVPTPKEMRGWAITDTVDTDLIASWAHKKGYDGVIVRNVFEGTLNTTYGDNYIVFSSDQIRHVPTAKKADPETGRYVTPFVSFDRQGEKQLQLIASLNSSRLATWGFTAEAEVLGMARYRISAVLDGRTSDFCRMISGKIFEVQDARRKVIEVLNVQDPNDLRTVQPWPKQTKQALAEFEEMDAEELTALGFHIPPYHPNCRTICRPVSSSEGEETKTTPTIPAETEVFQPVTADDLAELGIDATPEQVDDWNENVGMTPVELLSKFSGMPPQEVMTKPLGVGQNPIRFTEEGIGFNVRGADPQGVEFKLQAILEPFTGTYYLTQADLLAGSPKAELGFLKNMFSALIEMGEKSSATSIAVGVAGNAPYYAKMGFLPDELEWESLRDYALSEVEAGSLVDVMQSLAPEDQELVKHLLQDKSVGAMSALVELPFTYEGKTIGEWLFGDASGTWALDLEDEMLVEQAKAYLS